MSTRTVVRSRRHCCCPSKVSKAKNLLLFPLAYLLFGQFIFVAGSIADPKDSLPTRHYRSLQIDTGLFPDFDVKQALNLSGEKCKFVYEDPQYTDAQRICVERESGSTDLTYLQKTESEDFSLAMRIIFVNPLNVPKLSFISFVKTLIILMCGGNFQEALNEGFGLLTLFKILNVLGRQPIQVIISFIFDRIRFLFNLKYLAWVPKVGKVFDKISKAVKIAYKAMEKLDKSADAKCESSSKVLKAIRLFFKVWGILQYVASAFITIHGRIAGMLCDKVNGDMMNLLTAPPSNDMAGGKCWNATAETNRRSMVERQLEPGCPIDEALAPAVVAVDGMISTAKAVNASINLLDDTYQTIKEPIETVLDSFVDIVYVPLKPFLKAVEEIEPIIDAVGDVLDSIPDCFFCKLIMDVLFNRLEIYLKELFDFDVDEKLGEFLESLGFPDIPLSLDVPITQLGNITSDFTDRLQREKNEMVSHFRNLDVSQNLEKALNCDKEDSDGPYKVRIVTSTAESIQFTCPANYYPVSVKAVFQRLSCSQDMTGFFRFPCGNAQNTCAPVFFGDWVRCPLKELEIPEGIGDFPEFAPSFLRVVFFCVPFGINPNIIPVLRDLDSSGYQTPTDGDNKFPIWETPSRKLVKSTTTGNHFLATPLLCTNSRTIDLDSFAWLPKPCYGPNYNDNNLYNKDLCAEEYNQLQIQKRPTADLNDQDIQNLISSQMYPWREKDVYNFRTISYTYINEEAYSCRVDQCPCEGYESSGYFCGEGGSADIEGHIRRTGTLCGHLSTTIPICSITTDTDDESNFRYCGNGKNKHSCGLFSCTCGGPSTTYYYPSKCYDVSGGKLRYEKACPLRDNKDGLITIFHLKRLNEYITRNDTITEYYNNVVSRVETCDERFRNCNGELVCDLSSSGCENDYLQYACVDSSSQHTAGIVVHNFHKSKDRPTSFVYCPYKDVPRHPLMVKCEVGSGFEAQDCTEVIQPGEDCSYNMTMSWCGYSVKTIAARLRRKNNLFVPPDTLRVETICTCPSGFVLLPEADNKCTPCAPGEYRTPSMSECELVPSGYYSIDRVTLVSNPDQVGRRASSSTPTLGMQIFACPVGTYSDIPGSTSCISCPPGTFSSEEGLSSSNDCKPCPLGHVPQEDSTACTPCGDGQQPDDTFQSTCVPCKIGTYKVGAGGLCLPCSAGSIANETELSKCTVCQPGTFQPRMGKAVCRVSSVGYYVNATASTKSYRCPMGTTTDSAGAINISDCRNKTIITSCPNKDLWNDPKKTDKENCLSLLLLSNATVDELGNGFCQTCYNIPECSYDGGDCCVETCVKPTLVLVDEDDNSTEVIETFPNACNPWKMNCLASARNRSGLQCLEKTNSSASVSPLADIAPQGPVGIEGDGFCDSDLNIASMNYDGGDCCPSTCDYRKYEVLGIFSACRGEFNCLDPDGSIDTVVPELQNLPNDDIISVNTSVIPEPSMVTATDNDPCLSDVNYNQTFTPSADICEEFESLCMPWNGKLPDIWPRSTTGSSKKYQRGSRRLGDSRIDDDDEYERLLDNWEWNEELDNEPPEAASEPLKKGSLLRTWSVSDSQNNTATSVQTIILAVSPCERHCLGKIAERWSKKLLKSQKRTIRVPKKTPTLKCEEKCFKMSWKKLAKYHWRHNLDE